MDWNDCPLRLVNVCTGPSNDAHEDSSRTAAAIKPALMASPCASFREGVSLFPRPYGPIAALPMLGFPRSAIRRPTRQTIAANEIAGPALRGLHRFRKLT